MAAQVAPAPPDAQPRGPPRNVMAAPRGPPGPPRNIPVVDREKVRIIFSRCVVSFFLSFGEGGGGVVMKMSLRGRAQGELLVIYSLMDLSTSSRSAMVELGGAQPNRKGIL